MATRLFQLPSKIVIPQVKLSTPVKFTIISVGVGVTIIGLLARYLRRRKRSKPVMGQLQSEWGDKSPCLKSPNGDVSYLRRSLSPALQRGLYRQGSVSLSSNHQSTVSTATSTITLEATTLTPQQLGLMGMEALETAIGYWEDAIQTYSTPASSGTLAITNEEESEFSHHIQKLLETSYTLQNQCEQLFLSQASVLFRSESSGTDRYMDLDRRTITSISSIESFVSAQDMIADLREFDEFPDLNQDLQHLGLYQAALRQLEDGGIPYRTLRTEHMKCQSDIDYLAKAHCVRLAFQYIFEDEKAKTWFSDCGRQLITSLLVHADKDPKEFTSAYDSMLVFLKEEKNRLIMEEELKTRGVRCMTFYDIVLDFILLDAFEDLENPPSSVLAVVQNRWLSNGFKETALTTAVWSVLKAKRRILKCPDGFIAHFYNISEHTSPVLAWGFLGPEEKLRELCHFFKEQVLGFLQDVFSFSKTHYTTTEALSANVMSLAMERYEVTRQHLSI